MGRLAKLVLVSLLLTQTPGCLFVAGAAVVGGVVYVTRDDEAEVILDGTPDALYPTCEKELAARGKVTLSSKSSRRLEGDLGGANVVITLEPVTEKTTRIRCTARKNGGVTPDKDTAQDYLNAVLRATKG